MEKIVKRISLCGADSVKKSDVVSCMLYRVDNASIIAVGSVVTLTNIPVLTTDGGETY